LAKIAVKLEQALAQRRLNGDAGEARSRVIARGKNWRVADVLCTSGPQDRPFEEQHHEVSIAMVLAGTFQYRADANHRIKNELMTPGSLMIGYPGQCFECGHSHGEGDRCISFWYSPDYFERIASDAGVRHPRATFRELRVPALSELTTVITRASVGLLNSPMMAWEELSLKLAALTAQLVNGIPERNLHLPPSSHARVSHVVRLIERHPELDWSLASLAQEAKLSSYHFLRTFEQVAGVTPHQFIRRTRLREAALQLASDSSRILDVALDSGFGDVSNFNRAFRTEFGLSPRAFRTQNNCSVVLLSPLPIPRRTNQQ
jgi:AraC-like DNA-binding protein